MSDRDMIQIQFGAETAGAEEGTQRVRHDIIDVGSTAENLNRTLQALQSTLHEAFVAPQINETANEIRALEAETKKEEATLLGLLGTMHEGVESFGQFRTRLAEIAEVWMAAFAVERVIEWARAMGEAAEEVVHTSLALGESIDQVQQFNAMADATGMAHDRLAMATTRLDRAFMNAREGSKQQVAAFEALGISTKENYTQFELLQTVMAKFASMDGPAKTAIAMQLLGRGVKDMGPLLAMSKEQWDELNGKMEKYGDINDAAVREGFQLAEAFNENKMATHGLGNTLTQELAPTLAVIVRATNDLIAGWIRSYREGGAFKSVLEGVGMAIKVVIAAVDLLWAGMVEAWYLIDGAASAGATALSIVFDYIKGEIVTIVEGMKTLGEVILDVLSGRWDRIKSDWERGTGQMQRNSQRLTAAISSDWHQGTEAMKKDMKGLVDTSNDTAAFVGKLFGKKPPAPAVGSSGGGTTAGLPGDTTAAKSRVQAWQDELDEKLMAEGNFFGDSKQEEESFWRVKLALTTAGSKEWLEVRRKVYALDKEMALQGLQQEITAIQGYTRTRVSQAQSEAEATRASYDNQIAAVQAAIRNRVVSETVGHNQLMDLIQQREHAEAVSEERIYQIQMEGLQAELLAQAQRPEQRAQVLAKIEELESQHQKRLAAIVAAGSRDMQRVEDQHLAHVQQQAHGWVDPIVQAWGQGVEGMIGRTMTWQQALLGVFQSIASTAIGHVEKMVADWVVGEMTKTAATEAGATARTGIEASASVTTIAISATSAIARIGHEAAVAAAAAWSALAGIPVVGPFLAPAAAAAALAGVLALGRSIFSAAGGWDQVPFDGAMTQLHKDEMVLPASIASPLRQAVASGSAPSLGGAPGGRGDTFVIQAWDSRDVARFMRKNGAAVADGLRHHVRNGGPTA